MQLALKLLLGLTCIGVIAVFYSTRTLMKVGTGYSAKTVCSGVFVSNRTFEEVTEQDVSAPGHPLLHLIVANVDEELKRVKATIAYAPWTRSEAMFRPGLGCTLLPDGKPPQPIDRMSAFDQSALTVESESLWPQGNRVDPQTSDAVRGLLTQASAIAGTRAIVIVHKGRIIDEYYADNITPDTALLGWSLTKTVTALLAGLLSDDGVVNLEDQSLFNSWENDERAVISLKHLLQMESGLSFNEGYGNVSDVTRMHYLEPDMASFAEMMPLRDSPGEKFEYTSGSSNLIMKYIRKRYDEIGSDDWHSFPHNRLFGPIGMSSALLEPDSAGNFVGAAYLYATARDWARLGLFLLDRGSWNGKQLLSEEWIEFMATPSVQSKRKYGAHLWMRGQGGDNGFLLPDNAIWLLGHDGQSIAVLPSQQLVVVRLGLTPGEQSFKPQALVQGLIEPGILH